MNNRSIVNLFAIAVLVVPADSGMAQKPIPKEKAQTEEKSKAIVLPSFAQDPIEVTADTLSLGYRGHSCNEIAKRLKAINPTKDEFETTDAYVKRIEGISSLPFYGNVTAADTLAFLHSEGSMFPKYDADLGLMRIDASFMGQQILTKPTIRTLKAEVINHNVSRRDTYQASNSYGKTVTVTKTVYEVCAVVFDNKNVRDRSSLTMKVSFPLPPEEAKAAKDHLSIL